MGNAMALLLIDPQVNMFDPEDPVVEAPRLLATLRDLVARARSARVPVIYVQHDGRGPSEPGTRGWEIHPALAPGEDDPVVRKRTRDAFEGTGLRGILDAMGVRRLVVAGMLSEGCVRTTCLRAAELGYALTLVEDAHGTCDLPDEPAAAIVARVNAELAPVATRVRSRDLAFGGEEGGRRT